MARGRFITFEGVEGVGKTTQIERACDYLAQCGVAVIRTREPGGTPLAEAIRDVLLNPAWEGMHSDTELLLMFAARAEHVQRLVLPALTSGKWVLCDRFTDATYAYQGGGRAVSEERIQVLEEWVQGGLRPDLTIVLDVDVRIALARARARSQADRFERECASFFERVRDMYLNRAGKDPNRYRVIDAAPPADAVSQSVITQIAGFLSESGMRS